jgi:hypothetical protein
MASAMTSLGMHNACISMGEFFLGLGSGQLTVLMQHAPVSATADRDRVTSVTVRDNRSGVTRTIGARYFVDATELGDLLPMTGHPDNIRVFVVGGPGKHSSLIPSWGMTKSVTLPVTG